MDNLIIEPLIKFLQDLPILLTSLILFLCCISSILILFKIFGKYGLYIHSIVAVLAANIQVLKLVQFSFAKTPVALGTIVFASTYLCSGILVEHYDQKTAEHNLWFCFAAQILMTLLMVITIGHKPLPYDLINSSNMYLLDIEQAIKLIFTPLPRLLLASLLAFIVAQKFGIWIFNIAKKFTHKKYLWLRTIILVMLATTLDTIIFNLFAWKFLAPNPINLKTIFYTYIFSTLITQGLITIFSTPIIYLSYKFKPYKLND